MPRKIVNPGSVEKDTALVPYETSGFGASVIKGIPASSIPDSALADGFNIVTTPVEAIGRFGSLLWTETPIPSMPGREGYTASKTGEIITATAAIFTEDDAGNFWVWPGETHDEIIEYLTEFTVRVASTDDRIETAGCRIVGRTNLWQFHKIRRKWIFQFGQDVYVADVGMTAFTRCLIVSRDVPQNAISGYSDFDDDTGLIFNSAGMFKVDLSTTQPLVYRINTPIPDMAIQEEIKAPLDFFQYHYLYSGARLSENGLFRNRLSPTRIEVESGTNLWGSDYRDYSEIWTPEPIGGSSYTYGKLTCGLLGGVYQNAAGWAAIVGLSSFLIEINGTGPYDVVCDFAEAENMADVASIIQAALWDFWPDATCEYLDGRFVLTSGRIDNGQIGYAAAGAVGTDISALMGATLVSGALATNPRVSIPKIVGPLYVPKVEGSDPIEYQWHLTHFPVYRTRDLNNQYKIETKTGQYNDPNAFIWTKDLRICAAFYATRGNGIITALVGEFEVADVGSTIEWEDGSRDTIIEYIDEHTVKYSNGGYYHEPLVLMAAAIGNGRVMRASQTGNVVTRTHGGTFTDADLRRTIQWATGYRSYITRVISANEVEVSDDFGKEVQGFTMDPIYRYYNDTTSDKTLETRKTTLLLKQRFWQAMENGNVGIKVPGLVFTARRGSGELHYGQVPDNGEYLCGYHDAAYQITKKVSDDIQLMYLFKGAVTFWTSRKTWRWPLEAYEFITNLNTKDAILVITGIDVADEDRGLYDWGCVEAIGDGAVMVLTSEPGGVGWRSYNGFQYGPNILEIAELGNERLPDIRNMQKATKALYDGVMGLMLWGRT